MTNLLTVPRDEIDRVLPLVDIDRAVAVAGDRYAEGEIERDLKTGHRQLWLAVRNDEIMGFAITRVYKNGVCQIELSAGYDLDEWFDHIDSIEAWADSNGLEKEVVGRPGWHKKLKAKGYKVVGMIWRKQ